jgi:hypothetical protein
MKKHFIQEINYQKNTNFIEFLNNSPFNETDNIRIYEIINKIDSFIEYFTTNHNNKESLINYRHKVKNYYDELKKLVLSKTKFDLELNNVLNILITETEKKIENYIINLTQNDDFVSEINNENQLNIVEKVTELKINGYLEFEFELNNEFNSWSKELLDFAREKYSQQDDWRGANSMNIDDNGYLIIQDFINQNNIIKILSEYKKMKMEFLYSAWDYSHKRQKWFRNNHIYDKIAPTNYYHFDADEDVCKMLIYLTDVTENDGPFKAVRGSNTNTSSIYLTYIYYILDTKISQMFNKKENLYGRGIFLYRKDLFMKFPRPFMGSTHFGDDLIEGDHLANYLLENTTTFTRKSGTAVLFDGYKTIHAGGNSKDGERLAIQVAFRRSKSFKKKITLFDKLKYKLKSI